MSFLPTGPPFGPQGQSGDFDAAAFRENERELEANAERYAQLHEYDPPRRDPLSAVIRPLRRRGRRREPADGPTP